jgi:hypothetical protein
MASNGGMMYEWWLGMNLEESGRGLTELLSRHMLGGSEETHEKTSNRVAIVPAEIRTDLLPNTSLDHYC